MCTHSIDYLNNVVSIFKGIRGCLLDDLCLYVPDRFETGSYSFLLYCVCETERIGCHTKKP